MDTQEGLTSEEGPTIDTSSGINSGFAESAVGNGHEATATVRSREAAGKM